MKKSKFVRIGVLRSIFSSRYLFSVSASFMLACAIAFFVNYTFKLIFISALCLLSVLSLVFFIARRKRKGGAPLLALALACLLSGTLALSQSLFNFDVSYAKYSALPSDREVTVCGTVVGRRYYSSNISSFEIKLDSIDSESGYGGTSAILDCMYIADLQIGERFTVIAKPLSLADYSTSVYDERDLLAQGFSISFTSYSEESLRINGKSNAPYVKLLVLRSTLTQKLCIDDAQSGGIAAALLLGDKSMLPDTARRDFSRSGVSHILALSGLHVTVLFGVLDLILRAFLVPKRVRIPLIGTVALLYLALIGFLPSAVRAVIMLFFTYAAYVLSEDSDPVTSLGVAGAVIMALSPRSVADFGFWMSFFATLGIVCFSPRISAATDALLGRDKRRQKTFLRRAIKRIIIFAVQLLSGIAIGISACTFTLWAVSLGGGSISLLSPITTLILTPAAGFMLVASILSLVFYSTPIGAFFSLCIKLSASFMTDITGKLSLSSDHIVSISAPYVPIICISILVLALCPLPVIRRSKKQRTSYARIVAVPLVGILILSSALGVSAYTQRNSLDITYITPSGESEFIILQNRKDAVICDFSNGGSSSLNRAIRIAEENGAIDIATLVLTDYHSATPGSLYKAFANFSIERLWLPQPQSTDDYYTMLSCIEKAELATPPVEVFIYRHGEPLTVFDHVELCLERTQIERSVRPILLFTASTDAYKLAYLSPTYVEGGESFKDTARASLDGVDALIFGRHGPIVKQRFKADLQSPEQIILASKEVAVFADLSSSPSPTITVGEWKTKITLPHS